MMSINKFIQVQFIASDINIQIKDYFLKLLFILLNMTLLGNAISQSTFRPCLKWGQLTPIPDKYGFAGSFAGVSNGALLVAGGANFPDGGAPWTGSVKVWYDHIYVLDMPGGKWKLSGKLPRPLGYGASITWQDGLICLGGSDVKAHYAQAFILRYRNGKIEIENLPQMPKPLANTNGAVINNVIYIAGGTESPKSQNSEKSFWCLDMSVEPTQRSWKILDAWPGPSRMLSVTGVENNLFYLFSGANLIDGKRKYLQDAYKYEPGKGWTKIANLPRSVAAAPASAFSDGQSHLLIFGGDDGKLAPIAADLKEKHPGFSKEVLCYNTNLDRWTTVGEVYTEKKKNSDSNPNESIWAPVTTSLVIWNGNIILPGGEVRPATRTSRVLIARYSKFSKKK
jgi:N-acetylneuraminic acid mutarotase